MLIIFLKLEPTERPGPARPLQLFMFWEELFILPFIHRWCQDRSRSEDHVQHVMVAYVAFWKSLDSEVQSAGDRLYQQQICVVRIACNH